MKAILSIFGILAIAAVAILPSQVFAQSTTLGFNLIGPSVSVATSSHVFQGITIPKGTVVRLTGSGSFDSSTGMVLGAGSITALAVDGTVAARGTWTVTSFQSFNPYGGPSPGVQGGLLLLTVSVTATATATGASATVTGVTLQVSCKVNAPAGAPDEGTILPGITDESISGLTLFHQTA